MPVTLIGPDWPVVRALRADLVAAPETGEFHIGGGRVKATDQLERFTAAGLRVPEYTLDPVQARAWVDSGHLVFGRNQTHSRGKDIIGPGHRNFLRREWWSRVVYSPLGQEYPEWRLHVFQRKVIAQGLKVLTGRPWRRMPVRNRANGWTLRHDVEPLEGLRCVARRAVRALGYDYGAVDMIVTKPDGPLTLEDVVVLEVNRLPAMDTYTRTAYVTAIRKLYAT